jgi:hypothetical protein
MNREIRLIPKNARARQIIKEWGDCWEVIRVDNVAFDEGQHALVAPVSLLEGESRDRAARWVKLQGDKKFDLIG